MKKYPHGLTLHAVCAAIDDYQRHEESVPEEGILAAFNTLLGHSDIAEELRSLERAADTNMAAAQALRDDMYHWKQRAEAAEAKLAELAKQEPVAMRYRWAPPHMKMPDGSQFYGEWKMVADPEIANPGKDYERVNLYTRPAPAADLAELVPVVTRLKRRYVCNEGRESEFIACVTPERSSIGTGQVWDDWRELSAILRKIEEAKK